ncbi:hypothetical protein HK098_002451 [Nowakowskiella sp. JEL0407]|nr:hypothetical protein HK098_002451 [Nowakowskiella sp. JEL0407]
MSNKIPSFEMKDYFVYCSQCDPPTPLSVSTSTKILEKFDNHARLLPGYLEFCYLGATPSPKDPKKTPLFCKRGHHKIGSVIAEGNGPTAFFDQRRIILMPINSDIDPPIILYDWINAGSGKKARNCNFFVKKSCREGDSCKNLHASESVIRLLGTDLNTSASESTSRRDVWKPKRSESISSTLHIVEERRQPPNSRRTQSKVISGSISYQQDEEINGDTSWRRRSDVLRVGRKSTEPPLSQKENEWRKSGDVVPATGTKSVNNRASFTPRAPRISSKLNSFTVRSVASSLRTSTKTQPLQMLSMVCNDREYLLSDFSGSSPSNADLFDFVHFLTSHEEFVGDPSFVVLLAAIADRSQFILGTIDLLDSTLCRSSETKCLTVLKFIVLLVERTTVVARLIDLDGLRVSVERIYSSVVSGPNTNENIDRAHSYINSIEQIKSGKVIRKIHEVNLGPTGDVDINDIPILPTTDELFQSSRDIALKWKIPDNANGWPSLHKYQQAHYLMLREEYIGPLREICHELFFTDAPQRQRFVLYEVQLTSPGTQGSELFFNAEFRPYNRKTVDFSRFNRLQFGSLVVLFKMEENRTQNIREKFRVNDLSRVEVKQSVVFGTIAEFKLNNAQNGLTSLAFSPDQFRLIDAGSKYFMIESPAYFVAFHPVLSAMKTDFLNSLPLANLLILDKQSHLNVRPSYLDENFQFDISFLYDENVRSRERFSIKGGLPHNTMLDSSQRDAIEYCLSHRAAIVHGPPGTGKSFIGVQLARILSQIKTKPGPIIVVTYTNHALDQFLNDLAKYLPNVMRCGTVHTTNDDVVETNNNILKLKDKAEMSRLDFQDKYNYTQIMGDYLLEFDEIFGVLRRLRRQDNDAKPRLLLMFLPESLTRRLLMVPGLFTGIEQIKSAPEILLESFKAWISGEEKQLIRNWSQQFISIVSNRNARKINAPYRSPKGKTTERSLASQNRFEILRDDWEDNDGDSGGDEDDEDDEEDDDDTGWSDWVKNNQSQENANLSHQDIESPTSDDNVVGNNEEQDPDETITDSDSDNDQYLIPDALNSIKDEMTQEEFDRFIRGMENEVEDEFEVLNRPQRKKNKDTQISETLRHPIQNDVEELFVAKNIWDMDVKNRQEMHKLIEDIVIERLSSKLLVVYEKIHETSEFLRKIKERGWIEAAKRMTVVGMTSTFASRFMGFCTGLNPKVAIIEEAGELLEANLITSISSSLDHLILIGDHKQLRPKLDSMMLCKKQYNRSLFERLVENGFTKAMLNRQIRMRPEIASLTRLFYDPPFQDHPQVSTYPNVPGVLSNLFWITHSSPEDKKDDDALLLSKSNTAEARFCVKLGRYLAQQSGYDGSRVTLLSPYVHQVRIMRDFTKQFPLEEGRLSCKTIDNYQGEESDIVVLSLVRSNIEVKVGFTALENRAIVALSRARHGLFIVGNADIYEKAIQSQETWRPVISILRDRNLVSPYMTLQCATHPEKCVSVSINSDFSEVPNGGCTQPCANLLDCGHRCVRACHASPHDVGTCLQKCYRPRPAGCTHKCDLLCGRCTTAYPAECPPCSKIISRELPCGHEQRVQCHEEFPVRELSECETLVEYRFSCGHRRKLKCQKVDSYRNLTASEIAAELKPNYRVVMSSKNIADRWKFQTAAVPAKKQYRVAGINVNWNAVKEKMEFLMDMIKSTVWKAANKNLFAGITAKTNAGSLTQNNANFHAACGACTDSDAQRNVTNTAVYILKLAIINVSINNAPENVTRFVTAIPAISVVKISTTVDIVVSDFVTEDLLLLDQYGSIYDEYRKSEDRFRRWYFGSRRSAPPRNLLSYQDTLYVLPECRHVFRTNFLDEYMRREYDGNDANANTIKHPQCPNCRTPSYTAMRYQRYIKTQLRHYQAIKQKFSQQRIEEEIRSVVQAMGGAYPTLGHWFACPNGHPYYIGECGGAMQLSACPECGIAVGGGNHQLTTGNRSTTVEEIIRSNLL